MANEYGTDIMILFLIWNVPLAHGLFSLALRQKTLYSVQRRIMSNS
jgi:hypothetical protein